MSLTMNYTGTLAIETCVTESCGMAFAIPAEFQQQKRRDHKGFYCPRGHSQYYPGESDLEKAERLRKQAIAQRDAAHASAGAARDQAAAAERSARATRGHLTRIRNKIANGVCPVAGCKRHFDNIQAHLTTQHPGWQGAAGGDEVAHVVATMVRDGEVDRG